MRLKLLFVGIFGLMALSAQAQQNQTFKALMLPGNARTAASGGHNVALSHQDVNMLTDNPALMTQAVHQHAALNFYNYYAGITYSSLNYAHKLGANGTVGGGLQYLNYGTMPAYDASGMESGEFSAADYALTTAYSHQKGNFRLGVSMKYAVAAYGRHQAHLLAADLGGVFQHPEKDLTVGLAFKNIGWVAKDFTASAQSASPFDVQAGLAFKPEFMPFRFNFTAYRLTDWRSKQQEEKSASDYTGDVLAHLSIGTEVLLHKNLNLRVGYNHQHRRELRLAQRAGGAGLSFGFLLKVKKFDLAYSRSVYHAAGGTNFFSLSSDLGSFIH